MRTNNGTKRSELSLLFCNRILIFAGLVSYRQRLDTSSLPDPVLYDNIESMVEWPGHLDSYLLVQDMYSRLYYVLLTIIIAFVAN